MSMAEQSNKEIQEEIDRLKDQLSAAQAAQALDAVEVGGDFLRHLTARNPLVVTESTGRVGIDVQGIPYLGDDGRAYLASVHITDVLASAKGRAEVAAKAAVERAALREAAKAKSEVDLLKAQAAKNPALAALLARIPDAD